jgi:hypothetical protein
MPRTRSRMGSAAPSSRGTRSPPTGWRTSPTKTPGAQRIGAADCSDETLCAALLAVNGMGPSEVGKVPARFDPHPLMNGEVDGQIGVLANEVTPPGLRGARADLGPNPRG